MGSDSLRFWRDQAISSGGAISVCRTVLHYSWLSAIPVALFAYWMTPLSTNARCCLTATDRSSLPWIKNCAIRLGLRSATKYKFAWRKTTASMACPCPKNCVNSSSKMRKAAPCSMLSREADNERFCISLVQWRVQRNALREPLLSSDISKPTEARSITNNWMRRWKILAVDSSIILNVFSLISSEDKKISAWRIIIRVMPMSSEALQKMRGVTDIASSAGVHHVSKWRSRAPAMSYPSETLQLLSWCLYIDIQ